MKQPFIFCTMLILFLISGCQQSSIHMNEFLIQTENLLKELDEIDTTASSFDGKRDIKFRLMVEGHPTEEEALILFDKVLEGVTKSSNRSDVWDYYNGYFDIKSYDDGVIYEANKLISKDLAVMSN